MDEGAAGFGGEAASPIGASEVEGKDSFAGNDVAVISASWVEAAASDVFIVRLEYRGEQAHWFWWRNAFAEAALQFGAWMDFLWGAIDGIGFYFTIGFQVRRDVVAEEEAVCLEDGHRGFKWARGGPSVSRYQLHPRLDRSAAAFSCDCRDSPRRARASSW